MTLTSDPFQTLALCAGVHGWVGSAAKAWPDAVIAAGAVTVMDQIETVVVASGNWPYSRMVNAYLPMLIMLMVCYLPPGPFFRAKERIALWNGLVNLAALAEPVERGVRFWGICGFY